MVEVVETREKAAKDETRGEGRGTRGSDSTAEAAVAEGGRKAQELLVIARKLVPGKSDPRSPRAFSQRGDSDLLDRRNERILRERVLG